MAPKNKLTSLYVSGYKSFPYSPLISVPAKDGNPSFDYQGKYVKFSDVTVLLGANGVGKSNIVSLFRLLNFMMTVALQEFIGRSGGAGSILHYGPQVTPQMELSLEFDGEGRRNVYSLRLTSAAPDTLIFTDEAVEYYREGYPSPQRTLLGAGHKESKVEESAKGGERTVAVTLALLRDCRTYQFHDTSENARIRKGGYVEDTKYLRSDAGNLAPFLLGLKQIHHSFYDLIVRTIRQVCPQFGDFELEPSDRNPKYVLLNWRDRHRGDYLLGPHQLSDGTLRFMALAALFLQPPDMLPPVIIVDEPELGLHPAAISVLADLVKGASERSQILLATQSETLVNHFDLEQIRPMAHTEGGSRFLDLEPSDFSEWLEEYSTGELWEKNIFGGGRGMTNVYAVGEGRGEQAFVQQVLAVHLGARDVFLNAALVGKPGHKGGVRSWEQVRRDVMRFLRMDKPHRPIYVTMMFDYFRMPLDWPGRMEAIDHAFAHKAPTVEQAIADDVEEHMGQGFDRARFIPYVQMHELEALVLACPCKLLEEFPERAAEVAELIDSIRGADPESIDDGSTTAPATRIMALIPEYKGRKASAAASVLKSIGIDTLRARCSHFARWLAKLEHLGA